MDEGMEDIKIDLQVTVNQHVSETGNAPELPRELVGHDTETAELVNSAGVIGHIVTLACDDVGRNVKRILGA